MKHPKIITAKLLLWVCFASAFALISLPKFASNAAEMSNIKPLYVAIGLVIAVAFGTWFWLKFGARKRLPELLFSFGIGLALGRTIGIIVGEQSSVWLRLGVALPILIAYAWAIEQMKKKQAKLWVYQTNNLIMALVTTTIGGMIGGLLPLWLGVLMFALFAIYDAIAVWKTKHMVTLATQFIDKGIIPGISYPYKSGKKHALALLGGGDTMFIAFAGASFARSDLLLGQIAIVTMTIAVCLLFWYSEPKKYYPALPYLFVGMLAAFPIWWLIR